MDLKPISRIILQAADGSEYYSLAWDGTTAISLGAMGGSLTVSHAGQSYTAVPSNPAALPPPPAPVPTPVPTPTTPTVPATPIAPIVREPVTLTVGPDKQFKRFTEAMEDIAGRVWESMAGAAPRPAQLDLTINLDKGTYVNDWASGFGGTPGPAKGTPFEQTFDCKTLIQLNPAHTGQVVFQMTDAASLYYGKAPFITRGQDLTLRRVKVESVVPNWQGENWSGVRIDAGFSTGNFLFEDCEFVGWADGVLGGSPGQTAVFRRVHTHDNGTGDGLTHNIYCNHFDSLLIEGCLSVGAKVGHLWKSRSLATTIRRLRLLDGPTGSASYCLHIPNGGTLDVDGLVMHKGPGASNAPFITVDDENTGQINGLPNPNPLIKLRNTTMISEIPAGQRFGSALGLWNARNAPLDVPDGAVSTWNVDPARMLMTGLYGVNALVPWAGGKVTQLAAMPALDFTSPVRMG